VPNLPTKSPKLNEGFDAYYRNTYNKTDAEKQYNLEAAYKAGALKERRLRPVTLVDEEKFRDQLAASRQKGINVGKVEGIQEGVQIQKNRATKEGKAFTRADMQQAHHRGVDEGQASARAGRLTHSSSRETLRSLYRLLDFVDQRGLDGRSSIADAINRTKLNAALITYVDNEVEGGIDGFKDWYFRAQVAEEAGHSE